MSLDSETDLNGHEGQHTVDDPHLPETQLLVLPGFIVQVADWAGGGAKLELFGAAFSPLLYGAGQHALSFHVAAG
ncbi:hypothetical protein N7454_006188 [Penicillium verhagenii]|nr:hypothetical protein N7454_006188 [Penicillium verhagenii]